MLIFNFHLIIRQRQIDDCFPQLYYAGTFQTSQFAIVTSYIKGRKPSWSIESDRVLCQQTLEKINKTGVLHNDARPSNFIIVEKQQLINLKNEELVGIEDTSIILDFGFSKKLFRKYNEDLKPENPNEIKR